MSLSFMTIKDSNYHNVFQLGKEIIDNVLGTNRTETFEWKKCTNDLGGETSDFIIANEQITSFLSKASHILKNNGYKIDNNNYHIDFHRYNLFGEKYNSELDWHEDDYGATNYEVCTAIFYLRKDKTIKGGDLLIKDHDKIIVADGTLLLLDGRTIHKPEDLNGTGCRDSIVVQFKRI